MNRRTIWHLAKTTLVTWHSDKVPSLAAALAYYTAFSIAPFLVICIGIAGIVLGKDAAQHQMLQQIANLLGSKSAEQIHVMIDSISKPSSSITATICGLIILIFGTMGLFGQLQDGLNTIWGVKVKRKRSLYAIFKDRFLSFAMVFGLAFLFLVSLMLSTVLTAWANYMNGIIPGLEEVWLISDFIISFFITTILFAMIFKILPDAMIKWRNVLIGAIITALLFTLGKFILEIYLSKNDIGSAYGAAGSLIVILIWVYYSAQILFLGAEFTKVYSLEERKNYSKTFI
jgi:membrane protein